MSELESITVTGKRRIGIWLALLGGGVLVLQAYIYTSWMLSGDFRRTPVGSDPIPTAVKSTIDNYQITSTVIGIVAIVWFIQGIVRHRKIDKWRLLMVGWLSAYWLDPWLSFLRPMFTYNSYAFNRGCWCKFIPFWQSPAGDRIAEPLLTVPSAYLWNFALVTYIGYVAMRFVQRVRPGASNVLIVLGGFAGIWVTESALDVYSTRVMQIDAWTIAFRAVSLWPGEYYQFPIYEFIFFPSQFVVAGLVMMSVGPVPGSTALEAGLERFHGSAQVALRLLAFVALCNITNFAYTTALGLHAMFADGYPSTVPSWLSDEQCGPLTGKACKTP